MNPQQMERWNKVIGPQDPQPQQMVQPPPQAQPQPQQRKQNRGKEYRMKLKDERGEYKVKIRQTKDGETKYNSGFYNLSEKPDLSVVPVDQLTPKGYRVYQQINSILNQKQEVSNEQPQQQPAQTATG